MNFLFEDIIHPLGLTLLDSLWQGALVLLVCGGLLWLLRHRASRIRYYVLLSGLFALPVMALVTFSSHYQPTELVTSIGENLVYTFPANVEAVDIPIIAPGIIDQWHLWAKANANYICLFWVLGFALFTLRLTGGFYMVHKLKKGAESLLDKHWVAQLSEMSEKLKIKVQVSLLQSAKVTSPIVLGYLKPVIIFPIGLIEGLPTDQIEAILLHELAHIKRFDYLLNVLVSGLQLFFFYHPAYWWLQGQLDSEREYSCDDMVLNQTGNSISLIKALAAVREFQVTGYSPSMAFAGQKNQLLKRVERIMKKKTRTNWLGGLISMSVLLLSFFLMSYQSKQGITEPTKSNGNLTVDSLRVIGQNFTLPHSGKDSVRLGKIAFDMKRALNKIDSISERHFQLQQSGPITLEQATLDLIHKEKSGIKVTTNHLGEITAISKKGKEITGETLEVYKEAYAGLIQFAEEEKSRVFDEFHAIREASLKKQLTRQLIILEKKLAKADTLTYRPNNILILMSNIENLRAELGQFEKGTNGEIRKQSSYSSLINSLLYEIEAINLVYEKRNKVLLLERMEEKILKNLKDMELDNRRAIQQQTSKGKKYKQATEEQWETENMKDQASALIGKYRLLITDFERRRGELSKSEHAKILELQRLVDQYAKTVRNQTRVITETDRLNGADSDISEETKLRWAESMRVMEQRLNELSNYRDELAVRQVLLRKSNELKELLRYNPSYIKDLKIDEFKGHDDDDIIRVKAKGENNVIRSYELRVGELRQHQIANIERLARDQEIEETRRRIENELNEIRDRRTASGKRTDADKRRTQELIAKELSEVSSKVDNALIVVDGEVRKDWKHTDLYEMEVDGIKAIQVTAAEKVTDPTYKKLMRGRDLLVEIETYSGTKNAKRLELNQKDANGLFIEEVFTKKMLENLESDGVFDKGWSSLSLSPDVMMIDGKKQTKKTLRKYLKLYKEVTGKNLPNGTRVWSNN